jgi:peptidyl-dipeptidase Dcp
MWANWPAVLQHYAKHHETGAPIPQALIDKVLAAAKFNQGFLTTEYLEAAMLDQRWHQITADQAPDAAHVMSFEKEALIADGVDYSPVPPRYRTPYFRHIMSSVDGYNAGYYAYVWAEVLDANTRDWFRQHGGPTRENGHKFRDELLSRGGSVDAMELFEKFIGHEPRIEPLLEKRGLSATASR